MKMETTSILLQILRYISRSNRPSPVLYRRLNWGKKITQSYINMCIYIIVSIMSPNRYGDIVGDAIIFAPNFEIGIPTHHDREEPFLEEKEFSKK